MEMFQLVDRDGNPSGSAERAACHGDPRLAHLVVHLHLFDAEGRLYMQKRALSKDTHPGAWDTSVGGHVMAGESVAAALLREAREELGIDAAGARFLFHYRYSGSFETELAHVYSLEWRGEIHPDPAEIEEGGFFELRQIDSLLGTGALTPMFEHELPMLKAHREPRP
jgi:isopentenyl-diphosphate delta-isomerase type 1